MNGLFNGNPMQFFVRSILAPLAVASLVALTGILWSINTRIASLDARLERLTVDSDKNDRRSEQADERFDDKMRQLEIQMNQLRILKGQ